MYSATGSGTQYRSGRPSRARRRTSVAEISTAGTGIDRSISGDSGTGVPGRAKPRSGRAPAAPRPLATLELRRGVAPDQQHELAAGLPRPQRPQGVHGVGRPGRSSSTRSSANRARPRWRAPPSRPAARGRSARAAPLERLLARRHEPELARARGSPPRPAPRSDARGGSGRTTRRRGRSSGLRKARCGRGRADPVGASRGARVEPADVAAGLLHVLP